MLVSKKFALALALGLGGVTVASAADLPARVAAPAPAPVFVVAGWTGSYVGLNIGYGGWGSDRVGVRHDLPFNQ